MSELAAPFLNFLVKPAHARICRALNSDELPNVPLTIGPIPLVYRWLINPSPLAGTIVYTLGLAAFALLVFSRTRLRHFFPLWVIFFTSGVFLLLQFLAVLFVFCRDQPGVSRTYP